VKEGSNFRRLRRAEARISAQEVRGSSRRRPGTPKQDVEEGRVRVFFWADELIPYVIRN
jgi:hypothetical protein